MRRLSPILLLIFVWRVGASTAERQCPPIITNVSHDALTISVVMDGEEKEMQLTYGDGKKASPWKIESTDSKELGPKVFIHKFRITDLKASVEYPYNVAGFESKFRASPSDSAAEVLFLFGGDYTMPSDEGIKKLEEQLKKQVDFFVDLGDHLTNRRLWGKSVDWVGRVPVMLARGNHDNDPKYTRDKEQIQKYLDFPDPSLDYSLEWGPVMLRAEDVPGYSKPYSKEELQAIEKAYTDTKCPWKFYACHHIFFSDGPHGHQEFEEGGKKIAEGVLRRQQLWPIFKKQNVKFALNGHDHLYQRTSFIDGEGKLDPLGTMNVTFGGIQKTFNGKSEWSAFQLTNGTAQLAYVLVKGNEATLRLIQNDGTVIDEAVVKLK
ncbi:MAG: metallophosphoesterase [Planctomycetes bacterium]|nr:metallophosphoesterase [Planctomycetota bacterium]